MNHINSDKASWVIYLAIITILFSGFLVAFNQLDYTWNWHSVWDYRQKFIDGMWATIWISLVCLLLSTLIGFATATLRLYGNKLFVAISQIYVEFIRGTPLLVQILVFFYVIANMIGLENRYAAGIISLSLFSGAYMSEIIRSGIQSVGESQKDSARAIGLNQWQSLRLVILPQAIRVSLPSAAGQLVSLIKDSSLLSVIAISELTLNAQEVNSFTYSTLESYVPLALLYLSLTMPLSLAVKWLESRFRYET